MVTGERPTDVSLEVGILVRLPLRTRNPLNQPTGNTRVAGIMRSRARAEQRGATLMAVSAALSRRRLTGAQLAPVRVTVTRISPGRLDPHDGLGASLKGVIDGVAEALGIDDGDETRIRFVLRQRKEGRGVHGVEVLVEHEVRSKSEFRRLQVQRGEVGDTP